VAGTHADICGLAAPGINPYWTGGYTYFHRRLPIVWSEARPDLEAANYVLIAFALLPSKDRTSSSAVTAPAAAHQCRAPATAAFRLQG
jgi:hypothetical protein